MSKAGTNGKFPFYFAKISCVPAVSRQPIKFTRNGAFKMMKQIQGDAVRVSARSRNKWHAVIAAVRGKDFPVAV